MINNEKILKMIYIYQSGYSTHGKYTLEEWFEAREYCNRNYTAMKRVKNRININMPSPRI